MITMTQSAPSPTRTGLTLFLAGLLGVASLLTVHFPTTNLPKQVLEKFSPDQLRLLMLVNPLLLLIVSVIVGSLLYRRVELFILRRADFRPNIVAANVLLNGMVPGVVAGLLIIGVVLLFRQLIPNELAMLGKDTDLTPVARFMYGGITEEILVRFGLMTLFVWLLNKVSRSLSGAVYWIAIVGAALLFGAGHLPAMRLMVAQPSAMLVSYIMLANTLAGIVFGWVYWRHGLVFAMIAHATAHVILLISELVLNG